MKYELVKTDTKMVSDKKLYRIKALVAIGSLVSVGDLGGYVESEKNLSQVYGNAWVCGNARVYGNARVSGNAQVSGDARVSSRNDWLLVGPSKSSGKFTTAFKDSFIGVRVVCGCFSGTVAEFSKSIEETHKNNQKHLEQYRLFCQLIAFNFGVEK